MRLEISTAKIYYYYEFDQFCHTFQIFPNVFLHLNLTRINNVSRDPMNLNSYFAQTFYVNLPVGHLKCK